MPAPYVIHTVGPIRGENGGRDAELLSAYYRNSPALTVERGMDLIAFPAIFTGICGHPPDSPNALRPSIRARGVERYVGGDVWRGEARRARVGSFRRLKA